MATWTTGNRQDLNWFQNAQTAAGVLPAFNKAMEGMRFLLQKNLDGKNMKEYGVMPYNVDSARFELFGFTWTGDGATTVSWTAGEAYVNRNAYDIAAGSTSAAFIYWHVGDAAFSTSATAPTLAADEILIARNIAGTAHEAWNHLAPQSVGAAFLEEASIGSAQIGVAAIGSAHIQTAAITSVHIAEGTIITADIGTAAIQTYHLGTGCVTSIKIGTEEVTSSNIANLAVGTAHLDTASVTAIKIGTAEVTSAKIASLAVLTAHLDTASVTTAKIGNLQVQTAQLDTASVTAIKIGTAAVGSAHIANLAVGTAHLDTASVTNAKVDVLDAGKITTGYLSADRVDVHVLTVDKMVLRRPELRNDTWTNHSPSAPYVAWNAHTLDYGTVTYSIAAGNTNKRYVYWVNAAASYSTSDTYPVLAATDFLIATNTNGVGNSNWNKVATRSIPSSSATVVVAASDTSEGGKARADYVCDGTSDQVEINAAIAALPANGGRVLLLEGTFFCNGTITMKDYAALEGQAAGSSIKIADGVNANLNLIDISATQSVTITGLYLDGNKINNDSGTQCAIYAAPEVAGWDAVIANIYITSFRNEGMYLAGMRSTHVADNHAMSCGADGIEVLQDSDNRKSYNLVCNNTVGGNGGNGLYITQRSTIVANNTAYDNTLDGIALVTSLRNTVANNTVYLNAQHGISLSASTENLIEGNMCEQNGQDVDNTYDNIFVDAGSDYNTISGNQCRHASDTPPDWGVESRYGIRINSADCDGNFVVGNDLYGGGATADLSDAGTASAQSNNRLTSGVSGTEAVYPWTIDIDVFMTPATVTNWTTLAYSVDDVHGATRNNSTTQNAEVGWDVVLAAGTWTAEVMHQTATSAGIVSVQFDAVEKGTIDFYAVHAHNVRDSVTGIVVASTAKVRLTLKVTTKNASSTNYGALINGVRLMRTA